MDKLSLPLHDKTFGSIVALWERDPMDEFWADYGEACERNGDPTLAATALLSTTKPVGARQSNISLTAARAPARANFSRTRPRRNWGWLIGSSLAALLLLSFLLPWNSWFSAPVPILQNPTVTAVSTPDEPRWSQKRIEEIQKDDIVLAFNTETGLPEPRRVVQVFQRLSFDLRLLDFQTAGGEMQRFETTDEHPFWVPVHRDYVDAKDLQIGDEVQSHQGERQKLVRTEREFHPEGVLVYNFEVEGLHNYFVLAPDRNGPPVLVHNANYVPATHIAPPHKLLPTHGVAGNPGRRTINYWTQQFKDAKKWNADPAVVVEHNGSKYLLDGHHRVQAARKAGVDAVYRTVTEAELPNYGYKSIQEVISASVQTIIGKGG